MTTSDDELLASLASLARAEEHQLSVGDADDPRLAALLEPFTAAESAQLEESVVGALAARPDAAAMGFAAGPRGLRAPKRRLWVAVPALAAAAAALLMLQRPAELPAYTLAVNGGIAAQRNEPSVPLRPPGVPLRLAADAQVDLVLQPATAVEEPLDVHVFVGTDGALRAARVRPEVSPTGAVRIATTVAELFGGEPGPARLVVLLSARPLDAAVADDVAGRATSEKGVQRIELAVEVVPAPP